MNNKALIEKIINHAEKIVKYCEPISNQSDFFSNPMLVESCVFNLIQIGETANKLETVFVDENPNIPWHALYGLRNRIVHDYDGVKFNLVWDIVHDDIPELIINLEALL